MKIEIDRDRLWNELQTLAAFSDTPAPSVTRVAFSDTDRKARAYVKGLCEEEGLTVREDAVGNMFARWEGSAPWIAAVGTGSHIDAIPHAGAYDGTVGVLGGLEAIRALRRAGAKPHRSIDIIMFTSEEPTRFGLGCLGSRLMSGALDAKTAAALTDKDGRTLEEVRKAAGFTGDLESVRINEDQYITFFELHIEQGPILQREGVALGVVTAIASPASLRFYFEGEGGHAGAVLMPDRKDAFLAAAEVALALEREVKATGAIDTVGTVGVCDVFPGAINSIPSRVKLEVDIRDTDAARRDAVVARLDEACAEVAQRRKVKTRKEVINMDPPCTCGEAAVVALYESCRKYGLSRMRMVSRAYHDSLFMSRVTESAMLFIPCRDGVSHRPEEYSTPEAIAQGALVLADAITQFSGWE